jgi:microcin C transport system substrate-binding protein
MNNSRRLASGWLVLLMLSVLAACQCTYAEQAVLPSNLSWQTNGTDPEFADPGARRGGRFRTSILSFPATLRLYGPDSNDGEFSSFNRGNALSLVGRHPNTLNPTPELATHWAFGDDKKTIYFKLDPDARWSDDKPVTADDYLFAQEFMRSKFIVDPFSNDYFTNVVAKVVKYDTYTISVEAVTAKPPYEMLFDLNINPIPKHFHKLNAQWVDDYNWKIEPNTGAYQISDIRKGKYLEFKRKADWWANDKRFFRHRFNPDYIRVKIIRDFNIAYNYFAKGEIDTFGLGMPRLWYKKAQGAPYDNGYIGKIKFYNDVPRSPFGLYVNEDDPILSDRNVRLGLSYSVNFDKLIRTILRNDYERINIVNEGYGDYSNDKIRARPFDPAEADKYFRQSGWIERGQDGIRVKNGQRLTFRISYVSAEQTSYFVLLREEARKAGVELTLQQLDSSTWGKQLAEKKHQLVWMGFGIGGVAPDYWQMFHSANAHKPQTNNVINLDDKNVDAKIDQYRAATDKETRVRLAHELEQLIFDNGGFITGIKKPYVREAFWRWIKLPPHYATRSSGSPFDTMGATGGLFWIDEAEKDRVQKARILHEKLDPIMIIDETWRTPSAAQDSGSAK